MAKREHQKKKIMVIADFLEHETDALHTVSMQQILEHLDAEGIEAERKSVYDDIKALQELGYDIEYSKANPQGYYVAQRRHNIELAELKLLVEAVEASRFLSEKKTNELIAKLEGLCSRYEAGKLQRQVYVSNRIKSMNESIYYNVDLLHQAIAANEPISFQYYEWNAEKKLVPKKNGERYLVLPRMLVWFEENYYLVAIDKKNDKQKYYRVDKMKSIKNEEAAEKTPRTEKMLDTALLTKKTFGMFDGTEERVRIQADEKLAGVLLDRFGKDMILVKKDDGKIEACVDVFVSNPFFGWIFGVGGLKITEPEHVKKQYTDYLKKQLEQYEEE